MTKMEINVSAVALMTGSHLLTVRKHGTRRFMLPGGKPKPHEDAVSCALRETVEELSMEVERNALKPLGVFTDEAANEPGAIVNATIFHCVVEEIHPVPSSEIEEFMWIDLNRRIHAELAPVLERHIIPAIKSRSEI